MDVIAVDVIKARGHALVKAAHRTTFEISKDRYLTPRGDCIIAIEADKGAADLSQELRMAVASDRAVVLIELTCNGVRDFVICRGSRELRLRDGRRVIVRRSRYVDDATLCIESNKSARDLSRDLVAELQKGGILIAKVLVLRV